MSCDVIEGWICSHFSIRFLYSFILSYFILFFLIHLGAAETEEADIRKFMNHAVQDDNAAVCE